MNVVFAGTPEFAARALTALLDAGIAIPLVLTRADQPAGRGMTLSASPVKRLALARGIAVLQPASLRRDAQALERLATTPHDVMVVAAYGMLLPPAVLAVPPRGCLNIHASLLPRWRGAAPIARAIEAGDEVTGVSIMRMDEGLDTGAVLLARSLPIARDDTAATLHDKLADLGAAAIVEALATLGRLTPRPQPTAGVTYAHKIAKDEAPLDFTADAAALARKVRAFDPFPGATARLREAIVKVWGARAIDTAPGAPTGVPPGTILSVGADGIVVACGLGNLVLTRLQRPGGRRVDAREFTAATALAPGQHLA